MDKNHRRLTVSVILAVLVGVILCMTSTKACAELAVGAFGDYLLQTAGGGEPASGTFTPDEFGLYNPETIEAVDGDVLFLLDLIGNGDPFIEYTLRATNMSMDPVPQLLSYSMGIDIQPTAGPAFLMRSTVQYTVEDTDGNGMAELFGQQGSFLSDNRTNFINPDELIIGGPVLSAPGQMHQEDTGLLPLPVVPANFITDMFGVMGIGGDFAVSPGDTAVITGRFEILVVPEPSAAMLLLALCGVILTIAACLRFRDRRSLARR